MKSGAKSSLSGLPPQPDQASGWQLLLEEASQPLLTVNSTGEIKIANRMARNLFGGLSGTSLQQIFPEAWTSVATAFRERTQQAEISVWKDARRFLLRAFLNVDKENISEASCVFEEQPTPQELQDKNGLNIALETLIDSTSDGLCICNPQGEIVLINRASARFYGTTVTEIIGRNVTELVEQGLIDRSAAWEVIQSGEVSHLLQQRGLRKLIATGIPVHDSAGKLLWIVVSERDITEIDTLQRDLEKQIALKEVLRMQVLNLENLELDGQQLIARSPQMLKVLNQTMKVSKVSSSVLIFGESGVGKGVIADLIHKNSDRAVKPIIKLNCGAIPEALVESELFGYEKGAFTGAHESKPGYFEMADGGLVFLDEIAELPLAAQVKLLRFLEDGRITRLGGTTAKTVDVRIVAATHRDLEQMVAQGRFRHDLYYRLNVIPIHVPAVRDRRDCVLPMIHFYLKRFCDQVGVQKRLTQTATETLLNYSYPGNVRELMNICERLVVMTESSLIDLPDLPAHVVSQSAPEENESCDKWPEQMSLQQIVESVERQVLSHGLQQYRNQAHMAEVLRVNQSTITRKLQRYGLR